MDKKTFLSGLREGLTGLPEADVEDRLSFYSEMIDDRMEEGLSEEEAVANVGTIDEVVSQIISDTPLAKIVKDKVKPSRTLKAWEIVLIVLGFPLWFSLLAAAFAIVLALYIVLWALVVSLWAIEIALWAGAIGGSVAAVMFMAQGNPAYGIGTLGAAFVCAGLAMFLLIGCIAASKGAARLAGKIIRFIKCKLVKRERKKDHE